MVTQDSGQKLRYVTQIQARSETALRNAVSDLNPGASNADIRIKMVLTLLYGLQPNFPKKSHFLFVSSYFLEKIEPYFA